MLPQRWETLGRERTRTGVEHRIRLLTNLAGALAELGLIEEAVQACGAISLLRVGLASDVSPAVAPWVLRPIET